MLLPFDLRADREGWTVFEVASNRPAFLDGLPLTGLCLENAEDAVNALNKLEIAFHRTARKMVEVPLSSGVARQGVNLPLNTTAGLPCPQALKDPCSGRIKPEKTP
jgi:hypothetical protein